VANELVIKVSGDVKNLKDKLDELGKSTEELRGQLEGAAKAAGIAFAAFTAEIGLAVNAYAESQQAANRLSASLRAQGLDVGKLTDEYKKQASAIQDLAGYDDDAVIAAQAAMQALIGQTEITSDLTLAMANLAAAKDMDLTSTAELIGKGISGHTMALKKLGIEIDDNLDKEGRMAAIIEQVNQKFHGQAEAAGSGVTGAMRKLKESFGGLQEAIGERFAPLVESLTNGMAKFFKTVSENQGLVRIAAGFLGAGAAIAGLITGLAGLGVALTTAGTIAAAFGTTLTVALGPIGLIAAAVGVIGAGLGIWATRSREAVNPLTEISEKIAAAREEVERLEKTRSFLGGNARRERIAELKEEIAAEEAKAAKLAEIASKSAADQAAIKAAADQAERDANAVQAEEMSKKEMDKLRQESEAAEKNYEIRRAYHEHLLQIDAEYRAMDDEARRAWMEAHFPEAAAFYENQAAAAKAARQKQLQEKFEDDQKWLADQKKHGAAWADLQKGLRSEEYQNTKSALSSLAQLQSSSSREMKEIGKAAAIADISIRTAESAMKIYDGFSAIPIIGQALGIAGAAAAIAFGGEQINKVMAAAHGGVITGGRAGVDSVPAMLMPGEIVAPTANFEEVIGSVRAAREAERILGSEGGGGFGGGGAVVELRLKDNLGDFIEATIIERRALGTSLGV
jgi:hypothetical protein